MTIEIQVQDYITNNPDKMMTIQKFAALIEKKRSHMIAYLVQGDVEHADAEDILQDYAMWGWTKDWEQWNRSYIKTALEAGREPDLRYAFRRMRLDVIAMYRDKYGRGLSYTREVAYTPKENNELDPIEVDTQLAKMSFGEEEEDEVTLNALVEQWQYSTESVSETEDVEFQATEVYLAAVTERQAQAITLRRGRKNYNEIGEVMGTDKTTVCRTLQRGYETLRDTFPELRRASRQWDSANLYVAPEGVATWNHNGFPHDTRELQYGLPRYYSEPAPEWDDAEVHRLHWVVRHDTERLRVDEDLAAECANTGRSPAVFTPNRLRPWTRGVAPVASLNPVSDTEKYFSSANRLFNCLGLGKVMSSATEALINKLMNK